MSDNTIPLEQKFELLKWEQAAPGRKLEINKKDQLPLLLKAQENDPAVTDIDLENADVTPPDGAWLAGLLKVNRVITKVK